MYVSRISSERYKPSPTGGLWSALYLFFYSALYIFVPSPSERSTPHASTLTHIHPSYVNLMLNSHDSQPLGNHHAFPIHSPSTAFLLHGIRKRLVNANVSHCGEEEWIPAVHQDGRLSGSVLYRYHNSWILSMYVNLYKLHFLWQIPWFLKQIIYGKSKGTGGSLGAQKMDRKGKRSRNEGREPETFEKQKLVPVHDQLCTS